MGISHVRVSGKFECPRCKKRFRYFVAYLTHMNKHVKHVITIKGGHIRI